ncbi:MAG: polysaccharide deacetylase family protein [Actinomycetota bacterium]|nr:polysaccharide deacetylase family protein [Actinomycetota bacterium]
MIRHALAPVLPSAATALGIPRTLGPENSRQRILVTAEGPSFSGVALTFDDGPHPEGTPAMLELLARAGARAMFFVVGEQVKRRPELVARIAGAGHLVGLHGHQHRLQLRLSTAEVQADLVRGSAAIEEAIGLTPVWHRPPYGIYSAAGLGAARAAGMQPLLWSRWGRDWRKFTTPRRIAARATRELGGGDVILLHDGDFYSAKDSHERTAAALALIMNELAERKLDTVLPI